MIRLTVSIALTLFIQIAFSQLSVDAILKKNMEATGLNNVEIKSFEITGYVQQGENKLPLKMFGIRPDFYEMQVSLDTVSVIKATNGTYSWQYNSESDSVIFYSQEPNMAEGFYQQWTGGLDGYFSGEISAEFEGVDKVENIEVYKLKLTKNNKVRYYFIDKISFLILKIEDVNKNEHTYYLDYKNENGLLLPHQLDGYKGNTLVMSMIFKKIQINPVLDKKIFNAPIK